MCQIRGDKVKNIIFDWTGVIKDALDDHFKIINLMFKDFGIPPLTLEELKETWKQPYMDFYKTHLPNLTMQDQRKTYFKAFFKVTDAKAYPGMVDLLKKLHSDGRKIILLSSDSPKTILNEIKDFGLEEIFEDMELEVHDKVEYIANLMKRNTAKVEDTIIVGDTNNEIEAGKKVGIKTIAVTWGLSSERNLKKYNPHYIVKSPEELEKILW